MLWDALVFYQNSFHYEFFFVGLCRYPEAQVDMRIADSGANPQGQAGQGG